MNCSYCTQLLEQITHIDNLVRRQAEEIEYRQQRINYLRFENVAVTIRHLRTVLHTLVQQQESAKEEQRRLHLELTNHYKHHLQQNN